MKPFPNAKKIRLVCFIMLMFVVLILSACSANEESKGIDGNENAENGLLEEDNEQPEVDYRSMEAKLTVYSDLYPGEWEEMFLPHLEDYFPNYTFNFITWSGDTGMSADEIVAAGTEVDIMIGRARHLHEDWKTVGLHSPMNDLMEKHGVSQDTFEPQYFDSVTIDGQIYALPIWNDSFVTFYNKEIFDRFGVDHPTDGMSWEEATSLANQITRNDNGKQYVGQWYSPKHILRVNQKSLPFVDPETMEPVIDSEGWHEWVTELFQAPMQDPGLQEAAKQEYFGHDHFRNYEEVAMYTYQTVWIRQHQSQISLPNWDLVAVPTFDGDGIGVQPYGQYIGLSSISSDPDAAMQVVKYLTGEEFQTRMSRIGFITPLKSQAVRDEYMKENGLEDKNLDAIFYNELANTHPISPYDEIVIDTMHHDVLTDIVRGLEDVNTALQQGKEIARKAIEEELLRQQ